MNNPFIQIKALHEYEKASKGPIKLYPSLELVRLEQKFFNKKKARFLNMVSEAVVIQYIC